MSVPVVERRISEAGHSWALEGGLLVAWMALLVADRVDLLGGGASFRLTPFLVLTPLLLTVSSFRLLLTGARLRPSRLAAAYLLLLLLLISVILLSTLVTTDQELSLRRGILLIVISGGTLLVAALAVAQEGWERYLVLGSKVGLLVGVAFGIGQVLTLLMGGIDSVRVGPATIEFWLPGQFGVVPRLSGQVADANRGGLLFLLYLFIILRWGERNRTRWFWTAPAVVMLLMTLSRSALLAAAATGFVAFMDGQKWRVSRPFLLGIATGSAVLTGWLILDHSTREEMLHVLEPLTERFALRDISTREHFLLLERGMGEGLESMPRAAIGFGYGNAYLHLGDVFPNTKYGNYHSLYVSMFAEAGVFALILSLVLLAVPLLLPGPFRALVVGLVLFNIFYQATAEPSFWFPLALAWLTASAAGPQDPLPSPD